MISVLFLTFCLRLLTSSYVRSTKRSTICMFRLALIVKMNGGTLCLYVNDKREYSNRKFQKSFFIHYNRRKRNYNIYAKQIEYENIRVFFLFGEIMPLFVHPTFMNFCKNANSRSRIAKDYIPIFYSICLATIGVCVFRCADFSWRTFYLYKQKGGKLLCSITAKKRL